MKKEKPLIFSNTIEALKNTAFSAWPAEPIDPEEPFKWMTRRPLKLAIKNKTTGVDPWRIWELHTKNKIELLGIADFRQGDIIWVRETFQIYPIASLLGKGRMVPYEKIPKHKPDAYYIEFAADNPNGAICGKWRSPLFLPRWAARFLLEVKSVRVEKLHDITEEDARAEGALPISPMELKQLPNSLLVPGGRYGKGYIPGKSYRAGFYQLWEGINAKKASWDTNPWVSVIEFMRVE
jgi:hypothetical protein